MRILYVTDGIAPYVIGGMQTVARRHIEWLATAGHEVFAIVPERPPIPPSALPATLIPIPWRKRTLWDAVNPWRYVHDLETYGRAVAGRVGELRPDVIYSEGPLVSALLDRPRHDRIPIVFHPHGLEAFQDMGAMDGNLKCLPLRHIVARHARCADIVISQGGRIDDLLVHRIGASRDRIRRLSNTATGGIGAVALRENRNPRNRFLFVGRDEPRKGLSNLIGAIAKVPNASLDVVGVPHVRGSSSGNMTFHGEIRNPEALRIFYRNADFLVVPSFAEGMPTVILEAFAEGLPVIATDVGAVAGAVIEGRTGFLVRRGDEGGLIDAMRNAIALSDEDYRAMSIACRVAMESDFSSERVRSAFLEIIAEATALGKAN